MNRVGLALVTLLLGACSDEQDYVLVTVAAPPAVHDAEQLRVTLVNAGSERTEVLDMDDRPFPVTFSLTAPGRTGDMEIDIEAIDREGILVGRGAGTTLLTADDAAVRLDTVDFVVNTDYAEDQYPGTDFEAHGYQVAGSLDGSFTVAYRSTCPTTGCSLYARRFDVNGVPQSTLAAAGTNGFIVNSEGTRTTSELAIATANTATIALWDSFSIAPETDTGISCRSIDAQGALGAAQRPVFTGPASSSSDVVAVAPLSNGNFASAWMVTEAGVATIRGAIVRPDCSTLLLPSMISQVDGARRVSVAANSTGQVLYVWYVSGEVRFRIGTNGGAFTTTDTSLRTAGATIAEYVRAAPLPDGFAVFMRITDATAGTGPGRIDMQRLSGTGMPMGGPVTITNRSGNEFDNSQGFGVTARSDGTMFVTWHACEAIGDGNMCGVFGKIIDAGGSTVVDEFVVPTTTVGDQTSPSVATAGPDAFVVVWRDASLSPPDTSGSAVRARIIYTNTPGE